MFLVVGFSYHITYYSADTHTYTQHTHTLTLNTMEHSDFIPLSSPLEVIRTGDQRTEDNSRQLDAYTATQEVIASLTQIHEQIVNSSEFAERQNPSMDEQAAFYAEDEDEDEDENDENNNYENENERLRRETEEERDRLYRRAYDDAMYDRFIGLEPTRPSYLPENEPLTTESERQRLRDEEERIRLEKEEEEWRKFFEERARWQGVAGQLWCLSQRNKPQ